MSPQGNKMTVIPIIVRGCAALALACLAVACGGTSPRIVEVRPNAIPKPQVPAELAKMLPESSHMVVHADAKALRGTPFLQAFVAGFAEGGNSESAIRADLFQRLDELLIGVVRRDVTESTANGAAVSGEAAVLLLRGRFTRGELAKVFRELAAGTKARVREDSLRGLLLYIAGSQTATELDDSTWVVGESEQVRKLIAGLPEPKPPFGKERVEPSGPSAAKESKSCSVCLLPASLRPMAKRLDFSAAHVAMVTDVTRIRVPQGQADPVSQLVLSSLTTVGLRGLSQDGLQLNGIGRAQNALMASALGLGLRSQIGRFDGHPFLASLGIQTVSSRLRTEQEQEDLKLTLALNKAEELELAKALGRMLRQRLARVSGGGASS